MLGGSGEYASFSEKILKIWCILVRFGVSFDQIVSRKIPQNLTYSYKQKTFFYVKINYYTKFLKTCYN